MRAGQNFATGRHMIARRGERDMPSVGRQPVAHGRDAQDQTGVRWGWCIGHGAGGLFAASADWMRAGRR